MTGFRIAASPRAALAAALSAVVAGCGGGGEQPQFPPPDVSVAKVVQRSITEWDDFTGRVQAVDAVAGLLDLGEPAFDSQVAHAATLEALRLEGFRSAGHCAKH